MNDIELIKKYVPENLQDEAINKLKLGYPVQYIIGNVEFYYNIIEINEDVLIPRFETEYLVDKTIKLINNLNLKKTKILEIGTGSGCISIALKKNLDCNITAIDISEKALNVAKKNAINNNVDINFIEADIHNFKMEEKYDVIISNPPYVPFDGKIDEKIKYEPDIAIYAPDKGLYFYKLILDKIKNNLKEKYLIAFEIGDNEGKEIIEYTKKVLPKSFIKFEKDYNNYDRYIFISSEEEILN